MHRYIIFLICLISTSLQAQQLSLNNQYQVNRYSLSPAYIGLNGNTESFIGFRQSWIGVQGAPEIKHFAIQSPVQECMGLGAQLISDRTGIFNHLTGLLSYAYHLPLNRESGISLGLSIGFANNRIAINQVQSSQLNDPQLWRYNDSHGTSFDSQFGVLFYYQNLTIGMSAIHWSASKIHYDTQDNYMFTLSRHYQLHASYQIDLGQDITLCPIAILRGTDQGTILYEGMVQAIYRRWVWAALTHRRGMLGAISVGGALHPRVAVNYTYGYGGDGMLGISTGTHEISIGYLIKPKDGKEKKKRKQQFTIFSDIKEQGDEIAQRLTKLEEQDCCKEFDQLQAKLQVLQQQLDSLKESRSPETENLKLKIKQLEKEIELLKLKTATNLKYKPAFVLENIYFDTNSDQLQSGSYPALDRLAAELKTKSDSHIKIVGYTDNVGDADYNIELSRNRALAVKNYLVLKGIAASRILTDGKGMENPLAPNTTEAGRSKNRRIEVSFTKP